MSTAYGRRRLTNGLCENRLPHGRPGLKRRAPRRPEIHVSRISVIRKDIVAIATPRHDEDAMRSPDNRPKALREPRSPGRRWSGRGATGAGLAVPADCTDSRQLRSP